jgi:hypothetical protein
LDLLASAGLQPSPPLASALQRLSTPLTPGALLLWALTPVGLRTHLHQVFQHPCSQFGQALIHRLLDLAKGRSWMLVPPFFHPGQQHQFFTHPHLMGVSLGGSFSPHAFPLFRFVPPVYHLSPFRNTLKRTLAWRHVNFLGRFEFQKQPALIDIDEIIKALQKQPEWQRPEVNGELLRRKSYFTCHSGALSKNNHDSPVKYS